MADKEFAVGDKVTGKTPVDADFIGIVFEQKGSKYVVVYGDEWALPSGPKGESWDEYTAAKLEKA